LDQIFPNTKTILLEKQSD